MDAVEGLRQLGFGDYEAKAYVALLQHDALNGYELAKAAGIPRPNVYGVLQKLEERGAVLRADTPTGARYSAVTPSDLLDKLGDRFRDALSEASESLIAIEHMPEPQYAWNLRGYPEMLQHARAILGNAREQALVAVRQPEARVLSQSIRQVEARGTDVTTLCLEGCPQECGHCRGHVHRYPVETGDGTRWLVIVADGAEMLAAEVGAREAAWSVRSRQPLLVEMATWYVHQTITQSAVLSDLRGREADVLSPETMALLDRTGSGEPGLRFVGYVRRLLNRKNER